MQKLMGHQLKEMAELSTVRQHKVILLASVISVIVFSSYGYHHLSNDNYIFGILNSLCLVVTFFNTVYLLKARKPRHTDIVLTVVLLAQGILVLLYGHAIENRLLWLFPILASTIFINSFTIGLLVSCGYCAFAGIAILGGYIFISADPFAVQRFFISLVTLCAICNTAAFFYSKAINYIQCLYYEGIEQLAYSDQLTGLANRWSFETWATAKLAEKKYDDSITALVFLDIDNFKHINDSYGHDIGDKVLKNFAHRLKNNVRSSDRKNHKSDYSIARFAGDEFVLLLYDVNSLVDLDNILKRICHLFNSKYQGRELLNNVTISVGAALYPQDADNLPELTRCADKAMYSAKHNGKNQYCYYQRINQPVSDEAIEDSAKVTPITKPTGSNT